jgi:putative glutamine amidotransferase
MHGPSDGAVDAQWIASHQNSLWEEAVVSRRPIVGLAPQTQEPIPGKTPRAWIVGQRYVGSLVSAGALPWAIPLLPNDDSTLRAIYDRLDGIFLTGGVDMDPACYQETKHERCGALDRERDATELKLVRWAREEGKPVFGVCRGIQVINVAAGGTLYQDVQSEREGAIKHDYFPPEGGYERHSLVHSVRVSPGTRLARIMERETAQVNSMHHQGIRTLGNDLKVSAVAPDGLIEAVESPNGRFLIGVQWHPEELVSSQPEMAKLFQAFVAAVEEFKAHHS